MMTRPTSFRMLKPSGENVASELTAAGRGAISVIGISGRDLIQTLTNWFRPASGRTLESQPNDKPIYGNWKSEDVIVCFQADDYAEVHCHGGSIARGRILKDLAESGFAIKSWNELPNGESAASQALVLLPKTMTLKTAAILTWQCEGALDSAFERIKSLQQDGKESPARELVEQLLSMSPTGLHLVNPWKVAIVGAPNVGKSSLINRIVGYGRSIVFDQPGTTRDRVTVETAIDGWPVQLIDTAGIRQATDEIEKVGVELAEQAIRESDLVIELFDGSGCDLRAALDNRKTKKHSNAVVVFNKSDLMDDEAKISQLAGEDSTIKVIAVSALTGDGVDRLLAAIAEALVPNEPKQGQAVPFLEEHVTRLGSIPRN